MRPSAGFRARRSPTSRKISLPVSAQECAASAVIEAEPVITATAVFATAINRFAVSATTTVRKLSPPALSELLTARQ